MSFAGIPGTFDRAMLALRHAQKIGLDVQFQTTVTKRNINELEEIAAIGADLGVKMWSLFFLIVTGRAAAEDDLSGEDYERVFDLIYRVSKTAPFEVKTTEAMHYRRFVAQKKKEEGLAGRQEDNAGRLSAPPASATGRASSSSRTRARSTRAASFPSPAAMSRGIRWWTSTATVRCSAFCATPRCGKANAACASTTRSAAAPARELLRSPAISWPRILAAPTSLNSAARDAVKPAKGIQYPLCMSS